MVIEACSIGKLDVVKYVYNMTGALIQVDELACSNAVHSRNIDVLRWCLDKNGLHYENLKSVVRTCAKFGWVEGFDLCMEKKREFAAKVYDLDPDNIFMDQIYFDAIHYGHVEMVKHMLKTPNFQPKEMENAMRQAINAEDVLMMDAIEPCMNDTSWKGANFLKLGVNHIRVFNHLLSYTQRRSSFPHHQLAYCLHQICCYLDHDGDCKLQDIRKQMRAHLVRWLCHCNRNPSATFHVCFVALHAQNCSACRELHYEVAKICAKKPTA